MSDFSMLPPHVQARASSDAPWEAYGEPALGGGLPEYLPPDAGAWDVDPGIYARPEPAWNGDPGIYAEPDPAWAGDPGIYAEPHQDWHGDRGIVAAPASPALPEDTRRLPINAPSIVPGLDFMIERSRDRPEAMTVSPPEPGTPEVDGVDALTLEDHMRAGGRGFLLPSIAGGVFSGLIAGMAVKAAGYGGGMATAAFTTRLLGHTALGVASGAAAGLLVAATSPTERDSLTARYAVAGGLVGAGTGAAFPGGPSRALGAAFGALTGAVIAGFTGSRLQRAAGG